MRFSFFVFVFVLRFSFDRGHHRPPSPGQRYVNPISLGTPLILLPCSLLSLTPSPCSPFPLHQCFRLACIKKGGWWQMPRKAHHACSLAFPKPFSTLWLVCFSKMPTRWFHLFALTLLEASHSLQQNYPQNGHVPSFLSLPRMGVTLQSDWMQWVPWNLPSWPSVRVHSLIPFLEPPQCPSSRA